jgi:hypothetical protein
MLYRIGLGALDWAPALFHEGSYNCLSVCYGHIAHYLRTQFYEE